MDIKHTGTSRRPDFRAATLSGRLVGTRRHFGGLSFAGGSRPGGSAQMRIAA